MFIREVNNMQLRRYQCLLGKLKICDRQTARPYNCILDVFM